MTEESPSPSSFSGDSSVLRFWQFFRQESSHLLPSLLPPVRFFDIHVASRLPRQLELWHRLFRAPRGAQRPSLADSVKGSAITRGGDRRRRVLRSQRNTGDRANFARAEEVISVPNERTEPNECTLRDWSEVVKMAHRLVLHSGRLASQGRQRLCSTRRPRTARVRDQPCGTLAEPLSERHAERVYQLSARR